MTDLAKRSEPIEPERIENDDRPTVAIGEWYWVKDSKEVWNEDETKMKTVEYEWLGCVVHIGSNFAKIEMDTAGKYDSTISVRVLFDEFDDVLRLEPNPEAVIKGNVDRCKDEVNRLMGEVKKVTARLGVRAAGELTNDAQGSTALAKISSSTDVNAHKLALIKAKDEELPALFEKIKESNYELAMWMKAETLPLRAMAEQAKGCIEEVEDRIFNVSLYAGLTEDVTLVRKGKPAKLDAKLHLMQRRAYMDEECLLGYRHGGMDFKKIDEFDEWISEFENMNRILPFPRCMIAFKVRRESKERDWGGNLRTMWINFELEQLDKLTFFYIRNGDRLYRMNCDLEFGELIFPSRGTFDPSGPMMAKCDWRGRVDDIISLNEYEDRVEEVKERERASKRWKRENPKKAWQKKNPKRSWEYANPHSPIGPTFGDDNNWRPFDQSNVYFDECLKEVTDRVKHYNRIAVIIQGLLDRSDVLHPHPPYRTWEPSGFEAAIKLIYDGEHVFYDGEPPDFEEYRKRLNAKIDADSVLIGQDDVWQRLEAKRDNARRDRSWRDTGSYRPTHVSPHGNPGPGFAARPIRIRGQKAIFRWQREKQGYTRYPEFVTCTISVPVEKLFNVSAYTPGEFKQFFKDPRTRAEYLEWDPWLLSAEEYYADNLKVSEPYKGK